MNPIKNDLKKQGKGRSLGVMSDVGRLISFSVTFGNIRPVTSFYKKYEIYRILFTRLAEMVTC